MPSSDFADYLCRKHCPYYRIGTAETLACQGALTVTALVGQGRLPRAGLPEGTFPIPPTGHMSGLDERICGRCEFRAADCDFQAHPPIPDSLPCGGYRLLALLLHSGRLTDADLANIDDV